MKRRRALRILGTAAGAPLVAPVAGIDDLLAAGPRVWAGVRSRPDGALETLNASQAALVGRLAEMIIPRTDTPGAADAGVVEFVDALLTGWLDDDDRDAFLGGLEQVDEVARRAFGALFLDCEAGSQATIAAALDAAAFAPAPRIVPEAPVRAAVPFWRELKRFTLAGFFTSREGLRTLGYRMIPGAFEGCVLLDQYGAGRAR